MMKLASTGALALILMLQACDSGSASGMTGPAPAPSPSPSASPSPTPSPSPTATPTPSANVKLGACVNMANMLEPPNEGDWGPAIKDQDFADIAAVGFKTVRLPVRFAGHALTAAPYTIDAAFLARVDHVVTVARAAGLRVILDMHNYDELMADPAGQSARFTALWRQVADHFRSFDAEVWFELMNEPNNKLNDSTLTPTLTPALAAVRDTNPTRKVVIGGQNWSGIDSLATVVNLSDANLVYTFHYYDPFNFTHQGATWVTPTPPLGRAYPIAGDAAALAADVAKAQAFMTRTGKTVFMGEYGANELIALDQRATYYKAVHDAFTAAGVDGCVWGYQNTFPFRVGGVWQDPLLRAIGL